MTEPHDGADDTAGVEQRTAIPSFINREVQQHIAWRNGDIVVSVPAKSGTTWMMNIVHQLRSGGDPDFLDIYIEVPWLELVPRPGIPVEELVASFDRMTRERRRAFKTHSGPGDLPYQDPGSGPDVKYVVVVRHPDEAIASARPFLQAHSDAWLDLWRIPRDAFVGPDLETLVSERADTFVAGIFRLVAGWWPLRHRPNVHLIHFADLKRDHEGSVRRIAEFLSFDVDSAQWPRVLEYTSFAWMKSHEEKFELQYAAAVPLLDHGGMIRKGSVGSSAEDGISEAISKAIADVGHQVLHDPQAFEWCYRGGPVPS